MTLKERFDAKVGRVGACLIWVGAHHERGYGVMRIDHRNVRASHVAWFLRHGTWPRKKMLHTCDTPGCVEVLHLVDGTQKQNMEDARVKGRLFDVSSLTSKLSEQDIEKAKQLERTHTQAQIGAILGVDQSTISRLQGGK